MTWALAVDLFQTSSVVALALIGLGHLRHFHHHHDFIPPRPDEVAP